MTNQTQTLTADEYDLIGRTFCRVVSILEIPVSKIGPLLELSDADTLLFIDGGIALSTRPELADRCITIVKMYRSLCGIVGDSDHAHAWFHGFNTALGNAPVELVSSSASLRQVNDYLEAHLHY